MTRFRWWLFRHISTLGWWICPEPHRSRLQRGIGSWSEIEYRITEADYKKWQKADAQRPAACEDVDDPDERCPRHPDDCVCWKLAVPGGRQ
jgi:hypothetical protein